MKTLKTFALLFMFLLSLASTAQRERNYIYLLDCTKSMTGYGEGNPNIWQGASLMWMMPFTSPRCLPRQRQIGIQTMIYCNHFIRMHSV